MMMRRGALVATRLCHRRLVHGKPQITSKDEQGNLHVEKIVSQFGLRLTKHELGLLTKKLQNGSGDISKNALAEASQKAVEQRSALELCQSFIEMPANRWDEIVTKSITALRFQGTACFAAVGTQVAGDAGMNIVGCCLVGCAAALGGGTLNNLLYGTSAQLHGRPGVFWAKDYRFLAVAVASCVATFFAWPAYCRATARHYLIEVIGRENLEDDGSVKLEAFEAACERDARFLGTIRGALPHLDNPSPEELFHIIDVDNSGTVDCYELQFIVAQGFDKSIVTYALDTLALASLSTFAVHGACGVGLHPIVAATSGVTACFGGILRDIFCGRSLAIGGQTYAFATGSGSGLYVLLREVELRTGFHIPLIARVVLSFGTIVAIRAYECAFGETLLKPMHGEPYMFEHEEATPMWEKQLSVLSAW